MTLFRLQPWYDVKRDFGAAGNGSTDDTAAVQAAIDAAATSGGGTVFFPRGTYLVSGAAGGSNSEDAQIRFPSLDVVSDRNVTIRLLGDAPPMFIWPIADVTPPTGGSVIKTLSTGGHNLFGCKKPSGSSWAFSSVTIFIENLSVVTYDNPNVTPFDFRGAVNAGFRNVAVFPGSFGSSSIPQPTHSGTFGVRFPATDNGAIVYADNLQVYGYYNGIEIGECFQGVGQVFLYACQNGCVATPMNHGASFSNLQTTKCPNALVGPGSGAARIHVHQWRYEYLLSTWAAEVATVNDAGNHLKGTANVCPVQAGVGPDTHTVKNGGSNFSLTVI